MSSTMSQTPNWLGPSHWQPPVYQPILQTRYCCRLPGCDDHADLSLRKIAFLLLSRSKSHAASATHGGSHQPGAIKHIITHIRVQPQPKSDGAMVCNRTWLVLRYGLANSAVSCRISASNLRFCAVSLRSPALPDVEKLELRSACGSSL